MFVSVTGKAVAPSQLQGDRQTPRQLIEIAEAKGLSNTAARQLLTEAVQSLRLRTWYGRGAGPVPVPPEDLPRLYIDIDDDTGQLLRTAQELDAVSPSFFKERVLHSAADWRDVLRSAQYRKRGGRPPLHSWVRALARLAAQLCQTTALSEGLASRTLTNILAELDEYPDDKEIRAHAAEMVSELRQLKLRVKGE